jgi:DNA-binding IclR family transcriptional regulator
MLALLVHHRLVIQDEDSKRYRLGPGVLALADAYVAHNPLARIAQPYLEELRIATEESVFLTEYVAGNSICIATAENSGPLRLSMRVGHRMPYHAAAPARAILAFRPTDEAEPLVSAEAFERFTPATLDTPRAVMAELARVRAQGYATCNEEMAVGVAAISVPILNTANEAVASVTINGPQQRIAGHDQHELVRQLTQQSHLISRGLGFNPTALMEKPGAGQSATGNER